MRQIVIDQGSHGLTPWLALAGAVIVATIAAVTAHVRLRHRLDADLARMQAQLDAERERLTAQLLQERALHDLSEYRGVIDETAATLWELQLAWGEMRGLVKRAIDERVTSEERVAAKRIEVLEQNVKLASHHVRLVVRFGRRHSLTKAFGDAHRAFATIPPHSWPVDAGTLADLDAALAEVGVRAAAFYDAAQALAGARIAV